MKPNNLFQIPKLQLRWRRRNLLRLPKLQLSSTFQHKITPRFLVLIGVFSILPLTSLAAISYGGGEYTNICGSGTNANFYACQANCNPSTTGECSSNGNYVVKWTCDGRSNECRSNESGWANYQKVDNPYPGQNKTVQIDVFDKNCREGGGWNCDSSNLKGYLVWYSGQSVSPSPSPTCNNNEISLSISPSTANQGSQINFNISGDASVYINDDFGGGVSGCTGSWNSKTCTAVSTGNFTWTHSWKHCEGNVNNCSDTCVKSTSFSIVSNSYSPPTVDIKANGSDGPITIGYNTSATLSWTSNNANSCTASNAWSGYKSISGSESTGNWTYNRTYTITCTGNGGSASDSVTVNMDNAPSPPTVDIKANGSDGPITIGYNTSATLSWTSNNANSCTASNAWSGYKSISGSESTGNLTFARTYTINCSGSGGSVLDSVTVYVTPLLSAPSVDLRVNGSDGSITIPYNTSAVLSWTSANADTCQAYNSWSGTKYLYGYESTGNLVSFRTYTINCQGTGGSVSDSVTVYVTPNITITGTLNISKLVRNLSDGTSWLDSVPADPGEKISFQIQVKANEETLYNVTIKDALPAKIIYKGNLKINDAVSSENIISGFNLGTLVPGYTQTISFDAEVSDASQFTFGETNLVNTIIVYTTSVSNSAAAKVIVSKKAVAGAATAAPTGLTNNLLLDSFFLPLTIAFSLIWLLKSRIILFEEWLDLRKKQYNIYRSEKVLRLKIGRIKLKELLQKRII